MSSSVAKKMILVESNNLGAVNKHLLTGQFTTKAQAGTNFTLIEEETQKPPKGMVLRRKGHSLLIEVDGQAVAEVQDFYGDQSSATFTTDGHFTVPTEGATGDVITSHTAVVPEEGHDLLVWPTEDRLAALWTNGLSAGEMLAIGVGVVVAGVAAGGGGGGGGSSTPADTTPPAAPSSVVLNDSDPTDGIDIKVTLAPDAKVGDKVITVVKLGDTVVATVETTISANDVTNGYVDQHIPAEDVVTNGTYSTDTHLQDVAGNVGDTLTNDTAFVVFDGLVHDDYIANAMVFVDSNNNGQWDAGEATTTTDSNGYFTFAFDPNGAPVLAMGGVDTVSGVANNTMVYRAYTGALEAEVLGVDIVLSPLSTLIAAVADQTVGSGGTVDAAALLNAASIVNATLGLGVSDPLSLLSFDPVAAATSSTATGQDIELLAVNRQLAVLLGSVGALVNGAATTSTSAGSLLATDALAELLLSRNDAQGTVDLGSSSDVETILDSTIGAANDAGVTADLRASDSADLTALADLVAGFTSAIETATAGGVLSTEALSTMRAASDTLISALANAGSEAQSERGGDLSLSDVVGQIGDIADVGAYVADQVANVADASTSFETNNAVGYVGDLIRLDIQLPSVGLGETVDTLTISDVPAGLELVYFNPLTKAQTMLTPDAGGVYHIDPQDVGYLAVRSTAVAVDDPSTVNVAENSLTLTATKTTDSGTATFTGSLQLDITVAPVITATNLVAVSDDVGSRTGLLAIGASTDDATPTITGTLSAELAGGEQLAIYDGSTFLGYATVVGTDWSFTPGGDLGDGAHEFAARLLSGSTLVSASHPFALTVDTTLPSAPTINPSNGDSVSGTAEPGSTVTISDGGTVLGTATTDENGRWSFTPTTPLADGTTLHATATDPAGNESTTSADLTVDAGVPPQIVMLVSVTDDVAAHTGALSNLATTNDATPTLAGTLSAALGEGESLVVYDGTTVLGTAVVNGTSWTFTSDSALPAGSHTFTASVLRSTVGGDKSGAASLAFTVTVDADAPTQSVTVVSATDDVATVTGAIADDASQFTNDARPAFAGTLSAGLASGEVLVAYDTVMVNGQPVTTRLGAAQVSGTDWSFTPSYALADATHSVTFRVEDAAGNVGAASNAWDFRVDTVAPILSSTGVATAIAENSGAGQTVYTATAATDASGALTWSLKAGSDAALSIDPATGAVTLGDNPDYEIKNSYSFTVVATDAAGNTSEKAVTLAILNDDAPVSIAAGGSSIEEGSSGTQSVLTYTVSRTLTSGEGTVDWSLSGVDAADLVGGQAMSGTLTFAAGEASKVITVTVLGDKTVEGDEQLVVSLGDTSGDIVLGGTTTATTDILDDDGTVSVSVDLASFVEGTTGDSTVLTYTVTRTNGLAASSVDWTLSGVDAADLAAGQAISGTISFATGETTKTFTVDVIGDKAVEGNETPTVTLSLPGANLSTDVATAGTTLIDDDSLLSVGALRGSVLEGNNGESQTLVFRISRSSALVATSVDWSVDGSVDAADLTVGQATSGSVSFALGETEKFISITVVGDRSIEGDEALTISLANAGGNAAIGVGSATTTLVNDDIGFSIESVSGSVVEGADGDTTPFVFRVVRSDASGAASIDYRLVGVGSEAAGETDFVAGQGQDLNDGLPSGSVSFAAGESVVLVTVQVAGDAVFEADETFSVVLDNPPAGTQILQGEISGTLSNDDHSYSIAAVSAATLEGTGTGGVQEFIVTRQGDASQAGSVGYTISGYADNTASNDDFTSLLNGAVTFAAGQTAVTLAVDLAGDTQLEGYESFKVSLAALDDNSEIDHGVALATINPDDVGISIVANNAKAFEDGGGVHSFTVYRTGYLGGESLVNWQVEGLGAVGYQADATDFGGTFPSGTLTFAAGVSSMEITFTPQADLVFENNEAYQVVLSTNQPGVILLEDTASGLILNDESGLTLIASHLDSMEGNPGDTPTVSFTVERSGNTKTESVVYWELQHDGTSAADFADGTQLSGYLTFAAGEDNKVVSLPLSVDNIIEADKSFNILITSQTPGSEVLVGEVSGIIRNDDAQFALQALSPVSEGDGGSKTITMSVLRTGDLTGSDTVDYTVAGLASGNAATADDFASGFFPNGTLLFTAGQSIATITINLTADSVVEANESFTVTLGNNSNGTTIAASGSEQTVTVLNDDDRLSIAALSADKAEGGSGTTNYTFTVTRDGFTDKSTAIAWSVAGSGGAPANAADFGGTLPSGTVTFAAGETVKTITVGVSADNLNESDETFSVVLGTPPAGTELATGSATGTIINDDTGLAITATTTNLVEGDSGSVDHVFTVTRSGIITGSTTVDWTVGGAVNAADFGGTLPSGTVSFAAGQTVKTITLHATGDTTIESTEGFTVTLSNASSNADIQVATANGSIVADDIQVAISAAQTSPVDEGAAGSSQVLSYTVVRSGDTSSVVVIDWAASGMSADDFAAGTQFSGLLTFAAGQTTKTINLSLSGDNTYESDETLTITLSNTANNPAQGHTTISTASAATVVANDDVSLSITADTASQAEGASAASTPYTFTITPTGVIGQDSVVEWRLSSASAASNDFVAGQDALGNSGLPSGTVTFVAGQTSAIVITVNVAGDSAVEGDEAFTVTLASSADNVELATVSASSTVLNDDTAYAISAVSADRAEGNSGSTDFTFMVVRSGVASGTATVDWAVAGSGGDAADATDFGGSLPFGTVTFTGTETTRLITVSVAGDSVVENDEGFTVTISNAPSPITTASATGVIRNEDQEFSVSANNATLTEGDSGTQPLIFTVSRVGDTTVAATVDYAVSGGAGVTADDYSNASLPAGTLTFAAGESNKLVTVMVRGDSLAEGDETYTLDLSAVSTGTLDPVHSSASTTVLNNDVALEIAAPVAAYEGSTGGGSTPFVFTVTRSGAVAGQETVVDWTVAGGSTTLADFIAGQDALNANFGLPSGKLTFAAGETVALITVNVAQDTQVELDDTLRVVLKDPSTANVELRTDAASTTILADDSGYSIEATDVVKLEGDSGTTAYTFTVTRAGDLTQQTTAHWAVTGSGGNPASASDFGGSFPSGDVTFGVGEQQAIVTVLVSGDQLGESDEGFTVTLSGVSGITVATASGTIENDDQNFSVSSAASLAEGDTSTQLITFTISRTGDVSGSATVDYAVAGGLGVDGSDYVGSLPSGTLTFAPDQNAAVVTVAVKGDTQVEGDESYTLTLSAPTGGATLGTATATTTITNDDTNFVLSAPADTYEGGSGTTPLVFTVTRTGDVSATGSVDWKLQSASGVATSDFVGNQDALSSNSGLPSGHVSFAANASEALITINVQGDTTLESNETLQVVLSNPVGGTIEGTSGTASTVVLTDDDSFAISGTASIWETHADSTVVYTVARTGSLVGDRELTWTISGSNGFTTADDLASGQASSGTLTFLDGATVGYLTVAVKGDTVTESDETMTVTLSGAPANTLLDTPAASTVIKNDDATVRVDPLIASSLEGNTVGTYVNYTFTVTRSGYTDQNSTVAWSIDTSANNSVDASDFYGGSLPSGTVTFGLSETTRIVTVQMAKDSLFEADETVRVQLSSPSVGTVIDAVHGSADGVVQNDDAKFEITAGTASLSEGDTGFAGTAFTYTITRSGYLSQTNTVNWSVAGGTASATDFSNGSNAFFGDTATYNYATMPSGTVTFADGETAKTVTVYVRGDTAADNQYYYNYYWDNGYANFGSTESDETFNLSLSNASIGSSLGTTTTYASTIVNDDTRLTMVVDQAHQAEKVAGANETDYIFTVTRSGLTTGTTTVNWNTYNSYGVDATDFVGGSIPSGTLTFLAGQTVQTITVRVQGDDTVENQESFYVRLSGGSGYDEISATNSSLQPNYGDVSAYIERDEALFNIIGYSDSYYRYLGSQSEGDTVADGGTGDKTYVIAVERTLAWAGEATVTWNVVGTGVGYNVAGGYAEAMNSSDFVSGQDARSTGGLASGTITFADGQSTGFITVTIAADDLGEMNEAFQVQLTGTSSGSSVGSYGTGYVIATNDDTGFTVGVSQGNVTEGGNLVYTIYRNDDTRGTDTIDWSWSLPGTESTQEGNTDTATWYKLDLSDIVSITMADGSTATYDAGTQDWSFNPAAGSAIAYDANTHTFSGTMVFTDGQSSRDITIVTVDDSWTESWRELAGSMVISNPINVTGEANNDLETPFVETNGSSSGGTYVYDNEPEPLLSVSASTAAIWEGTDVGGSSQSNNGNQVTFTITRTADASLDGSLDYPSVVTWKLVGSDINYVYAAQEEVKTIGGDATSVSEPFNNTTYGLVSFAAGETTKTVVVTFYGDSYAQSDKDLSFSILSAAEATAVSNNGWVAASNYGPANSDTANDTVNVTLLNDDIQLSVSYDHLGGQYGSSYLGNYEGKDIGFTISRTGYSDAAVTVTYTLSGAAVDSGDITGTLTGTVTIPAGQSSVHVALSDVTLVDDSVLENTENFTLTLSAPVTPITIHDDVAGDTDVSVYFDGGTATSKVMTGSVFDDDSTYTITNTGSTSRAELDTDYVAYTFRIQRTNTGATEYSQVNWHVEGISGITADDFLYAGGNLPSGTTGWISSNSYYDITVYVKSDLIVEGNDTFKIVVDQEYLMYSGITNTFSTPFESAVQTIINDDTGISIADATITETDANQAMVFTVTRSGDLSGVSTMTWALEGLTTDANDVTGATSGSLTFAANASIQTITITVVGDVTPENSESFHVTLSNLTGIDDPIDTQAVGSINNDDSSFAIAAGAAAIEGNGQVFTITRTYATVQDQVINWSVAGTTNGADGGDFAGGLPSGSVTFSGNALTQLVTITGQADTTTESDEDYTVTIGLGAGTTGDTITTSSVTGTIINDDADYTVTAGQVSALEGHAGITPFVFTITRSGNIAGAATLDWTLGSASADSSDFSTADGLGSNGGLPSGSVSFAAGETTVSITIDVVGDTTVESNEAFSITLSNPASGADGDNVTGGPASSTITNDDSSIAIVAVSAIQAEGNSDTTAFVFNVVRTGYLGAAGTVDYNVAGAGAHPADSNDFNGMSGTLDLPAGQATVALTILVVGDALAESDEDFSVSLSNASTGIGITSATAAGTIQADDIWFDVSGPASHVEGTGAGTTDFAYVVTRSGDLSGSQVINWSVAGSGSDPASASDFAATTGAVTFAAGETATTIHVQVNQDSTLEADENFTLSLSGPNGVHFTHDSVESTIVDDEIAFSITPATRTLSEGSADGTTDFVFTITRNGNTANTDSVDWTFTPGSNVDAADFAGGLPGGGSLTFGVSETTKSITITANGDNVYEADESFSIGLANNSAGTFLVDAAKTATANITNDDSTIAISVLNADQAEGNSGTTAFTFEVVRTGNLSTEATVTYTLAGSGANAADITAADFAGLAGGLSGTLSLPADQATTTLTIFVQGDRLAELDEGFTVTLSDPSAGVTVVSGSASASGTIQADDVVFDVQAPAVAALAEGGTGDTTDFVFTVTRDGKLTGAQVLDWTVSGVGGNAADSADFIAVSGSVSFAAGETEQLVTVQVKGDYASEPDEAFRLSLAYASGDDASGVVFTHASADATILNDEASFNIAATTTNLAEGASGSVNHVFTVTRSGNLDLVSTVDWLVANGTTAADDFAGGTLPTGSLTFAAGSSVQTITVATAGDTTTESDEGFTVNLANASIGANIISGTANGKIVSDDIAWTVTTSSIPSVEGDSTSNYVFSVVRTGGVGATTIEWSAAGDGSSPADSGDFAVDPSGTLVFAQGVMTQFITVQVAGDSVLESDEEFTVTLSAPNDGLTHAYTQQSASAFIVNDDDVMSIAALSADKAEGSSGTTAFTFTVTRDGSLAGSSTVGWHLVNGTTDNADFANTAGVVTFADNQSVATVTVNVVGDRDVEADQDFSVALVNAGTGSSIDSVNGSADGVIRNDDVDLALSAGTSSATEGDLANPGYTTFTVTRSGDLSVVTTVDWSVVAGSAGAADFAGGSLPGGTLTFAASQTVKTITVSLAGDGLDEGNENFSVQLGNQSSHADITSNNVTGTIVDDDDTLTVSAFLAAPLESDVGQTSAYVFRIDRTGTSTGSATVDWQVAGSGLHSLSADEFVATTGSVSFANGETSKFVTVLVNGDAVGEYDETFSIALSNPGYGSTVADVMASATVVNDDAALYVSANQPDGLLEGNNAVETEFTFTVVRSGNTDGVSTVDWHVEPSGSHQVNAMDFGGAYPSGSVVFGDGEATKQVTVKLLADADGEFDETFSVVLANPDNATIIEGSAESIILNDDTGISIAALGPVDQLEGNAGETTAFVYRVERVGDLAATTVDWSVAGTGDYQVGADDFVGGVVPGGTITFADGVSYVDITLQVAGDDVYGPDEGFRVLLSNNANLINSEESGVIRNDDSLVGITANAASHLEGDSGTTAFVFTVTRSGATDLAASVAWDVVGSGGHPANVADFGGSLPSGTIDFAAGETTRLITVAVSGDTVAETDEAFTVRLNADSGSGVSVDPTAGQASATILADDQGVLLFGLDVDHAEGQVGSDTTFTYQVLRTGNTGEAVTVNYAITGAVNDSDFVSPLTGSFVMAAGVDSYVLTLTAKGDALVEADEAFQVALSGGFATNGAVSGTIRGDDDGISIAAVQSSVSEGDGIVVFNIVAAGIIGQTVVNWNVPTDAQDSVQLDDFAGATSGVLTFAADGTQSITLQLADDAVVESSESLTVSLATSGAVTLEDSAQATVHVTDNDYADSGNDVIAGNDTADVLRGLGGADQISAGGGDDVIVINADNLAHFGSGMEVDGGAGIDTLFLDAADQTFDLTAIASHLTSVEKIDISGTGANTLSLSAADLASMTTDVFATGADAGTHQLMVEGDANDNVVIADFGDWTQGENYVDASGSYAVYNNAAAHAQLLVELSVSAHSPTPI